MMKNKLKLELKNKFILFLLFIIPLVSFANEVDNIKFIFNEKEKATVLICQSIYLDESQITEIELL